MVPGGAARPNDRGRQAEAGRHADAERLARSDPALAVPLGEVLVLTGRLVEAESVFTRAVRGRLPAAAGTTRT